MIVVTEGTGLRGQTTGQDIAVNNQLAFDILELFRKEIPYTLQQEVGQECDDLNDNVYCHNHKAEREKKDVNTDQATQQR